MEWIEKCVELIDSCRPQVIYDKNCLLPKHSAILERILFNFFDYSDFSGFDIFEYNIQFNM
jgi:hypothetical protein